MPTVETYPDDPLYPRIVRAVDAALARGKVVAPVDVLIGMQHPFPVPARYNYGDFLPIEFPDRTRSASPPTAPPRWSSMAPAAT
jgi:hypothetical protein